MSRVCWRHICNRWTLERTIKWREEEWTRNERGESIDENSDDRR